MVDQFGREITYLRISVTELCNLRCRYMPVVDRENRLVGIITIDDAMDVLQDENTEDFEKMAAITPTDKPYLKMSVFDIWKKRFPWLLLLMVSATFTSKIIQSSEEALQAYPVSGWGCTHWRVCRACVFPAATCVLIGLS